MGTLSKLRSDLTQARAGVRAVGFALRYRAGAPWSAPRLLAEHIRLRPDRPAIKYLDEVWTWKDLGAAANRWANTLAARGVQAGDTVGLLMDNRPEYLAVLLAVNKVGAVTACLNTNATGKVLTHAVNVSAPRLVVVGSEYESVIRQVQPSLEVSGEIVFHADRDAPDERGCINDALGKASPEHEDVPLTTDHRQAFLYTSGTTGLPKAATITQRRFLLTASGFGHLVHEASDQDVIYSALPLYHGTAQWGGFGASLATGAALAIRRKFSASSFWNDCRKFGATRILYIGEVCRYLVNQPPKPDDREHPVVAAAGNGLRKDVWPVFQERFGIERIREFYGSTEGNVAMLNLENRPGMIGRLTVGQALVACDPETGEPKRDARGFMTRLKEPGQTGLLVAKINRIAKFDGYLDEKATNKKILRDVFSRGDAYFNSGDLLTLNEDGWLSFADRVGDTYRWKSENVSTNEVAEILNEAPGVLESNVYGVRVPNAEGRAGMASLHVSEAFDLEGFAAHVLGRLASYQRPYFIRVQDGMKTTGTFKHQKVDYRAEGYDPRKVADPLYFLDGDRYVPIDQALHSRLASGEVAP